uniref:Choline/ethanolamine kinase n=1 Tax=Strongyloides venezuelensis TaxID=75913 RepID=A0A0K0F0V0_STRVS
MIRSELKKIEDATTPNYLINIKTIKFSNLKYPEGVTIRQLEKEVKLLEDYVKKYNFKIVFSHNDIFEGNIIVRNDTVIEKDKIISDDENDSIVVIYFEYSSYNFMSFHIAQIIHALAFSYGPNCDHDFHINQKYLTNAGKMSILVNKYLKEMYRINNIITDEEKFNKEISQLLFES